MMVKTGESFPIFILYIYTPYISSHEWGGSLQCITHFDTEIHHKNHSDGARGTCVLLEKKQGKQCHIHHQRPTHATRVSSRGLTRII